MNGNFSAFKNRERISEQKKAATKEKKESKKSTLANSRTKTELDITTSLSPNELSDLKNKIISEKKQRQKRYNIRFLVLFIFLIILMLLFALKMNII